MRDLHLRGRDAVLLACLLVSACLLLVSTTGCSTAAVGAAPSSSPSGETSAVVRGTLSDDAVVTKPIVNATVTIGGVAATLDGQDFSASDVPLGAQALVVTAPRHTTYRKTIEVVAGENTVDVAVPLTVKETYLRYFATYNASRFSTAYKMVHRDVRRRYSQTAYARYMKRFIPYLGIRIVRIRTLATWKPAYLGKTYRNVKACSRVLDYEFAGSVYKERGVMHWARVGTRWYCIFDWRH